MAIFVIVVWLGAFTASVDASVIIFGIVAFRKSMIRRVTPWTFLVFCLLIVKSSRCFSVDNWLSNGVIYDLENPIFLVV